MNALAWAGGQMIEAEGRHLGNAELAAGEQPAVPGDHLELRIDQHWHIETKGLKALAICWICFLL